MEKLLSAIGPLLDKLSIRRVLLLGLTITFLVGGFIGYQNADKISQAIFNDSPQHQLTDLSDQSQALVTVFMKKHKGLVIYSTYLTFKFHENTRLPVYRAFNNDALEKLVYSRLAGGDGALPIFIKNDPSNNNQMISIIQGDLTCDPFNGGGLSRVWPDLTDRIVMSCRVGIPPGFGAKGSGYMVAHLTKEPIGYEKETLIIDMKTLSTQIYKIESSRR